MTTHSSAPAREETPHTKGATAMTAIVNALKQRARSVLNDPSIDPQNRALLRYALEVNDPWLAQMVRHIEADVNAPETPASSKNEPFGNKVEVLVDLICRPGDEPDTKSAALLVLMLTLERSTEPTALVNRAKHLAFAHYDDLTVDDMIDAQITTVEAELFAGNTPIS